MKKIVILAAGGHAQVIAEILLLRSQLGEDFYPIGYLDDNPKLLGQEILGIPVLGNLQQLPEINYDQVIIAIGHNYSRQKIYNRLQSQGIQFATAIHPNTTISPTVVINPGTMICAGVIINPYTTIGHNTILNTACTIDHHNQIGSHAHIAPGVHIGGDVTIGEGTLIGIGANILPQLHIAPWNTIAAGATVTYNTEAHSTYMGTPAIKKC